MGGEVIMSHLSAFLGIWDMEKFEGRGGTLR